MDQPDLPPSCLRRPRRRARGGLVRSVCYVQLGFLLVLGLAAGLAYLRLIAAPVRFEALSERVAGTIAARMGEGWTVSLGDAAVEMEGGSLQLSTARLDIRAPGGALVVRAPHAVLGIDALSILKGSPEVRSIAFRDLQLRARINPDGAITFVPEDPQSEPQDAPAPPAEGGGEAPGARSALSAALASLFALMEPGGGIGALDQASIVGARLVLLDAERRERATFSRVNASLAGEAGGGRRFDLSLQGADGEWRIDGAVRPDPSGEEGRRSGTITVHAVPLRDLLLLSGQSALPVSTDLVLSGRAEATLAAGRIEALRLSAASGAGRILIEDPDMPEVAVEALAVEAAWDEAGRRFTLGRAAYRAGGTAIELAGTLALAGGGAGWALDLQGRDAVLDGAAAGDAPVRIEQVSALVSGRPGGVAVERIRLAGPTLQLEGRAAFGTDPAEGLRLRLESSRIDVRTALRLWPPAVAAKARQFLLPNLRAGLATNALLDVAMTVEDMRNSVAKRPIPDQALRMDFTITDGVIAVAEGLPPLGPGVVVGAITGTRLDLQASRAGLALPEGRQLAIPEASFSIRQLGTPDTVADIAVRAQGGVDALVALLQSPALREQAALDLDPAEVRGRADLRLQLRLSLDAMPALADLPVSVTGTLSEAALDKPLGRERLEGANLALRYGDGALILKGEARIGGAPAAIDLRQAPGGAGEAVVTLTLDEAARARRGLSFGAQLTGPVTVRAVAPLGRPGAPGTRVEIDLARAAVDNLLPGWTKPAGRPGRASFVLAEGGEGRQGATELADLVVESGTVLLKGSAALGGDGQLDRAELGTVRLSAGDQMSARIERAGAGLKVTIRGNNADARPVLKLLTAQGGAQGGAPREGREIDLAFGVNILTGFNGEQITGASVKAQLRQREIRQVQFAGKIGSARVAGHTQRGERGAVLTVETDDAGGLLRFLDVYKRMAGGALTFQSTLGDGPQSGTLVAREFRLRNDPALGRIIAERPGTAGSRAAPSADLDPGDVDVTRLRASFTRNAGRLDVKEAVIWGPLVGFSVSGFCDFPRDRIDIQGTFVPAYGLNNVFSQLPVFGPILGGGQNEGLFAVNFRVSGAASNPTLTFNPLSAIAPGFLRKLFGAASAGDAPPDLPDR